MNLKIQSILRNGKFYRMIYNNIDMDSYGPIEDLSHKWVGFDYDNNDITVSYIITDEKTLNILIDLVSGLTTVIDVKEITNDILFSNYNDKYFKEAFGGRYSYSGQMLEAFILLNLTADMVLDKIGQYGYSNLTEYDKLILQGEFDINNYSLL
jgi:hypothetical protein